MICYDLLRKNVIGQHRSQTKLKECLKWERSDPEGYRCEPASQKIRRHIGASFSLLAPRFNVGFASDFFQVGCYACPLLCISFFISIHAFCSLKSLRNAKKSRENHAFVLGWPQSQLAFSAFCFYAALVRSQIAVSGGVLCLLIIFHATRAISQTDFK